jgi:hypothetical protein
MNIVKFSLTVLDVSEKPIGGPVSEATVDGVVKLPVCSCPLTST